MKFWVITRITPNYGNPHDFHDPGKYPNKFLLVLRNFQSFFSEILLAISPQFLKLCLRKPFMVSCISFFRNNFIYFFIFEYFWKFIPKTIYRFLCKFLLRFLLNIVEGFLLKFLQRYLLKIFKITLKKIREFPLGIYPMISEVPKGFLKNFIQGISWSLKRNPGRSSRRIPRKVKKILIISLHLKIWCPQGFLS